MLDDEPEDAGQFRSIDRRQGCQENSSWASANWPPTLHVRSADPAALPLILTHGWPGSVLEFLDVIGPLSTEFHLVIPSIPGFGFSGPTQSKGWDIHRIARAWAVLMGRLGYQRYGAH